jgi:hypothetical protein
MLELRVSGARYVPCWQRSFWIGKIQDLKSCASAQKLIFIFYVR